MKRKAFGLVLVLTLFLAACASSGNTTTGTTAPASTTSAQTTAQVTTKPVEKPQYGGTLNRALLADVSSWDYGLTFC